MLQYKNCKLLLAFFVYTFGLAGAGCATNGAIIGAAIGTTVVGGTAPTHQLEQVYYLGVFDPHEQIDPTIYRVIVKGQSSALSFMRFGSGWVPAKFVDSLTSNISHNKNTGLVQINPDSKEDLLAEITPGRRLVLFGPEGFREAPKSHRLAIVMGSSPENFFNAIDTTLGESANIRDQAVKSQLNKTLFREMMRVQNQRESFNDLKSRLQMKWSHGDSLP